MAITIYELGRNHGIYRANAKAADNSPPAAVHVQRLLRVRGWKGTREEYEEYVRAFQSGFAAVKRPSGFVPADTQT